MKNLTGYEGFDIKSKKMLEVFHEISDYANHGQPIIMFGPSGSGKEFLAKYYYEQYKNSFFRHGKYLSLNCAGLSKELAHSELFGHVKGAFTGAHKETNGLLLEAQNGVLFLDEIGELEEQVQAMLLRALDPNIREARKLGDTKNYNIENTIVISATEQTPEKLRESFLYRLGLQIFVPGLNEREDDIESALSFFTLKAIDKRRDKEELKVNLFENIPDKLLQFAEEFASNISPLVKSRDWPGNFRALKIAIDAGLLRAKSNRGLDNFYDEAKKYFYQHLGIYSNSVVNNLKSEIHFEAHVTDENIDKWENEINRIFANIKDVERQKIMSFLSYYKNKSFTRQDFESYIDKGTTRLSQTRLKKLVDEKILLRKGKKRLFFSVNQDFNPQLEQVDESFKLMNLPSGADNNMSLEKQDFIIDSLANTSYGVFVNEKDSEKRGEFFSSLANKLSSDYSILYFSFKEKKLSDFVNVIVELLDERNLKGWFSNRLDNNLSLEEKIIGLSGFISQVLPTQCKTVIILDRLEMLKTQDDISVLDRLLFFWNPILFILGGKKHTYSQNYTQLQLLLEVNL